MTTSTPVITAVSPRPGAMLARFSEARGRPVFEASGIMWARNSRTLFEALPYEARHDPDLGELRKALRRAGGIGALYPAAFGRGVPSGLVACFPARYTIQSVEAGHRRQVRRGLNRSVIRPMDPDELFAKGLELNLQTMARQNRFDPEFGELACWRRFTAATASPGVAITGAFVEGRLSAYWVSCRDGAWLHLLYKMARTEDLVHRAAVALDFWMITEAAKDPTIRGVSNSFVSINGSRASVDSYKLRMGFEVVEHRLACEFHPLLHPALMNPLAAAAVRLVTRIRPGNTRLEDLSAVLTNCRSR